MGKKHREMTIIVLIKQRRLKEKEHKHSDYFKYFTIAKCLSFFFAAKAGALSKVCQVTGLNPHCTGTRPEREHKDCGFVVL